MAVTKVGKSGGAGGAIDYLLKDEKEGAKKPAILGGNVATFGTKEEIKKDFADYSKLKPNVKNEVVHLSISLKPGEHLEEEKKVEFSEKLLEKLNFKIDKVPYLIVEHHDKDYEHWHVVAGRIKGDAETVKEWKIAERAIAATKELEQEFGLEKVEYKKSLERQTKRNEYKFMERTGELSVLAAAKLIIDETLKQKPTTKVFVESLQSEGFEVKPNVSETTGRMNGFSYKKDEITFKSSAIGKQYSFQNLQKRGLDYDQERDTKYLIEVKNNESAAKPTAESERNRSVNQTESKSSFTERVVSRADHTSTKTELAFAGADKNASQHDPEIVQRGFTRSEEKSSGGGSDELSDERSSTDAARFAGLVDEKQFNRGADFFDETGNSRSGENSTDFSSQQFKSKNRIFENDEQLNLNQDISLILSGTELLIILPKDTTAGSENHSNLIVSNSETLPPPTELARQLEEASRKMESERQFVTYMAQLNAEQSRSIPQNLDEAKAIANKVQDYILVYPGETRTDLNTLQNNQLQSSSLDKNSALNLSNNPAKEKQESEREVAEAVQSADNQKAAQMKREIEEEMELF